MLLIACNLHEFSSRRQISPSWPGAAVKCSRRGREPAHVAIWEHVEVVSASTEHFRDFERKRLGSSAEDEAPNTIAASVAEPEASVQTRANDVGIWGRSTAFTRREAPSGCARTAPHSNSAIMHSA